MSDRFFAFLVSMFATMLFAGIGQAMIHTFDCNAIGKDTTEQDYFFKHHRTITDVQKECTVKMVQISNGVYVIAIIVGAGGYFGLTHASKIPKPKPLEAHPFTWPLVKMGLLTLAGAGLIIFIINAGNLLGSDGNIGASVIVGGIGWGIGIAFIVRGKQQERFLKK